MNRKEWKGASEKVHAANCFVSVLFAIETVFALTLSETLFYGIIGLPLLALVAGSCAVTSAAGALIAPRSPEDGSVLLASALTTGTLVSAMVLGLPEGGAKLALAMLGYSVGASLAFAAWAAFRRLSETSVGLAPTRSRRRRCASETPTPRDEELESHAA
jgi:hypothetical protein